MASSPATNTTSSDLVVKAGDNNGGGDFNETKAAAYRGDPEAIRKHLETFPPGYRFAPREYELIEDYLCKRQEGRRLPINNIIEDNIYTIDPQQLTAKYCERSCDERGYEKSWYFFTPRDRKYPNGGRPDRKAGDGYWKATGKDKTILNSNATKKVGCKKALVYYMGKATKGVKTNWIMHEYRTEGVTREKESPEDMKLDDCVLVRIHEKTIKEEEKNAKGKAKPKGKALPKKNRRKSPPTSTDHDLSPHSHMPEPTPGSVVENVFPLSSTEPEHTFLNDYEGLESMGMFNHGTGTEFLNDYEGLESMGMFCQGTGTETGQNQLYVDSFQNGTYPEQHQSFLPPTMALSHRTVAPAPMPPSNDQGTLASIPGSFLMNYPTQSVVTENYYGTTDDERSKSKRNEAHFGFRCAMEVDI